MVTIDIGTARSVIELIECVDPFDTFRKIFRGQPVADWPLLPKAGRKEFFLGSKGEDLNQFREWRETAVAFVELPESEWECLAVAQHHGLATRLLDWTRNLFVAAYFAAETHPEQDGIVFCLEPPSLVDPTSQMQPQEDYLAQYRPRPLDARILSQAGMFTYHGIPERPIEDYDTTFTSEFLPELFRIMIPKASKRDWLSKLDRYGINRQTLFPGLDGLSDYTNWRTQNFLAVTTAR